MRHRTGSERLWDRGNRAGGRPQFLGLEALEARIVFNTANLAPVFPLGYTLLPAPGGDKQVNVEAGAWFDITLRLTDLQAFDFQGGTLNGYQFKFNVSDGLRVYNWVSDSKFTTSDTSLDTALGDTTVTANSAAVTSLTDLGRFSIWAPNIGGTYTLALDPDESYIKTSFGQATIDNGFLDFPDIHFNVEGAQADVDFQAFIDLTSEPGTYVAGDTIDFRIDLLNPTNLDFGVKGTYDAYISTEEEFDPNTAIQVIDDFKFNYKFDGGVMLGADLKFKVPAEADKGDYRVFGVFNFEDPRFGVAGDGYAETSETFQVKRAFGTLEDQARNVAKLLFEDESGVNGTLSIRGGGKGFFRVDDSGFTSLRILESTPSTKISVKWERGQLGTIGSVRSTQPLGYLDLGASTVKGNLNFEGGVGGFRVQEMFDQHQINIGGAPADGPVSIQFGQFGDVKITSARPIKSITGEQWLDLGGETDQVVAPWVETVSIKGNKKTGLRGDFEADIITSDATVDMKKLTVAGLLKGARIQTAGNLKSATVGAMEDAQLFAGVIAPGSTLPDDAADFNEFALGSVTVKGIAGLAQASFVNSSLAAANIGAVKLKDVNQGDGNGADFGLAAKTIKSLQRLDQAGLVKLSNLDAPGDADTDPNDDFVIRVF